MRLLHVVPTYLPARRYGGPIFAVHGLCRALARRCHEVHVFTTNCRRISATSSSRRWRKRRRSSSRVRRIVRTRGLGTDTKRDYEYTDWNAVEAFAREFVSAAQSRVA